MLVLLVLLLLLVLLCCVAAQAAGPRFVTGKPYFTGQAGLAIGWKQPLLLYSTDPGDLSATVNHAAADALVAAAAGVWNVPVASISLGQGPALAEHVSGQNVYFDAGGLHFPADVMSTNAAAIPLAIVYDTDGSVTDTLLGAGASLPSGCRQNAVTESVDAFDPAGYILHAIIVINGRCAGTAAAAELQLRYQLQRVFGRVLGLAWSQTNDNVFTGSPTPTPVQAQNWPIMHPIDIVCGLYTYQCLPNPFTLRPDDIAGLVAVYPNNDWEPVPAGKQPSYATAQGVQGRIFFPTGEGMAGVNVLVRRMAASTTLPDAFYVASAVTGTYAVRGRSSPFVAQDTSALGSQGDTDLSRQGFFFVPWFPLLGSVWDDRITSTEPINPLYSGEYNLGPYPAGEVAPSGSAMTQTAYIVGAGVDYLTLNANDAAGTCGTGADGTPTAPMAASATGWWAGLVCGFGHVSYVSAAVRPGRTFTVEVTALDPQGLATTAKLMPVIGLYGPHDNPPWSLPSLGASVAAFNGATVGTTTLHASSGTATSIRFGIADQRGDGRPDFNYNARLFYADDLAPATVAASGGSVTITGTGFRTGNAVTVNGIAATVTSWTASTLVVTVPTQAAAGATAGTPADVTVTDRGTGATSTMTAALLYGGSTQAKSMRLVSAPAGTQLVGDIAAVPFSVQLVAADGVTPVVNSAVQLSVASGSAAFGLCGGASACSVRTDANGLATTTVTPTAAGSVTLQANAGTLSQSAMFNVIAQASAMLVLSTPESPLHVGVDSTNAFAVQDVGPDGSTPIPFRSVTFTALAGSATFDACYASPCTVVADWTGTVRVGVIPQSTGQVTVQARDGDLSQTVTVTALVNTDVLRVTSAPPAQYYTTDGVHRFSVALYHADGATPDVNQTITFTAPAGVSFDLCAQSSCTMSTDNNGAAFAIVNAPADGTYTIQAAYGSVVQTVTFTVFSQPWQLKVLSAPPDNSPTGVVAAQPFRVQIVLADGVTPAPVGGRSMILGGSDGVVTLSNCPYSACEIWMGSDATATAWITPQQPGAITLSAAYAPLVISATFTAAGGTRTMKVVQQPGASGAPIGVESDLEVEVIEPDGVTPMPSDPVTFTVLSGPFPFYGGAAAAGYTTGGDGIAFVPGLASGYGSVVVQASDGYISRLINFIAGTPPHVLKLVSVPASPSTTGTAAPTPFAVQVFASDGVTPAAGEQVTFTLTGGAATFAGCASATCVVTADAQGDASVQVTPLVAGVVGLLAADGPVTQSATFTAVAPPDVLRVLSAPATGSFVGVPATAAFTVQVLLADGVTPVSGRNVTLSVTAGSATLGACAGAASCVLVSGSSGVVSTAVTPLAAGGVTLQAVEGPASASASFNAVPRPDSMRVVSAPTGNVGVGYAASTAFTVQVLQGNGVTPEAGKTVVFSASAGSVRFGACAGSSCSVTTAADGTASTTVTPLAAGNVILVATEGALVQSASFNSVALPDVLRVTNAPASGGFAGVKAAQPFAVQVLLADGTTPGSGKTVMLSVTSGSATFAACGGASTCALTADASGEVTTVVTPLTAGSITLQAAEGNVIASASFTTTARPDTLQLLTAPAGTLPTGVLAAPAFAVQLLAADGTPDAGKTITFTATGAQFAGCTASPCTALTSSNGTASYTLTPTTAGTVTLTATYGSLSQTATFTTYTRPDTLQLVSAPTGRLATGVLATTAFSVQLLAGDGTPDTSKTITFTASGAQLTGCTAQPCTALTSSSGTASYTLIPTTAGTVTLTATYGNLTQTATFTAYTRPDTLQLVSAPAGTLPTGVLASTAFSVQLLAGDGTPDTGKSITFTAAGAQFTGCTAQPCTAVTAKDGTASFTLIPTTAGIVTLTATYGNLTQTATFTAYTRPDTLQLVSAPTGTLPTGVLAASAFSVQLLAGDGTPDAGKTITFTASGAQLTGCAAQPCIALTSSSGTASFTLTPTTAGIVTLTATYGSLIQTVTFAAAARPDTMTLLSAPSGLLPTGITAASPFTVQVLLADGTPDAGRPVVFAAAGAQLGTCSSQPCTVLTAADGTASVAVTPQAAGTVTLSATYGNLSEAATFTAYMRPDTLQLVAVPASGGFTGTPASGAFAVRLLAADGTPRIGAAVVFSSASATFAACAGSPCTLLTDATGTASTIVTPLAAGSISLLATADSLTVSASFTAIANQYSVTAQTATTYLAEGATAQVVLGVLTQQNGLSASFQAVHWTSSTGLQPASADTLTGSTGQSFQSATAGPLAAGAQAQATACAWSTTCATFTTVGVAAAQLQPTITSGAAQSAAVLALVTVTVTDASGHAIAGASISLYQTVAAYPAPCPAQGRCPAAAILASLVTVAASDATGRYTFQPLTVEGQSTETQIAVSAGTQGFTTTTLTRQP